MSQLFRSQRAMRNQRQAAIQRGIIALLDVGTSKITCLILRFDGTAQRPLGEGIGGMAEQTGFRVAGVATTRSRGVRFGEIDQMAETERGIRTAVQAAQRMANVRVDHVVACFSGAEPRSYGLDGRTELHAEAVSEQDVARVLASCDLPDYGDGRTIVHALPVNFAIDHRSGLADPRGQTGNTLAADLHLLTIDGVPVENLLHCITRCDLELAGLTTSAYASGLSSLVEDEQELGAACIDMGGGATGISIFIRKHMIYCDSVRIGGDHVTSDLSLGLQVPLAVAERLKTVCGGVEATSRDHREMIETGGDTGDWELDRRRVSRAELIGIIRPRIEETLEEVRARLDAAGFENLPSRRIVLTGGGSQIPGLGDLASRILGRQVRLGRPMRIHGLPQAAAGPGFAAAVGLCLHVAHPQDECWDFQTPASRYGHKPLRRAVRWFRDNW